MVNFKDKCTFITTYYNAPKVLFKEYVHHITKHGVKILICDDGSDKEYKEYLHELMGNNELVKIFSHRKNKGHEEALKTLLGKVETEYVIRCDSDDKYLKFPEFDSEDFDALLLKKTRDNLSDFLLHGGSPVGGIFKLSVMKDMYLKDINFITKNNKFLHEDIWGLLNFFKLGVKHKYATNTGVYRRQRHEDSQSAKKNFTPERKRWETFMLWCMRNDDFELYKQMQIDLLKI